MDAVVEWMGPGSNLTSSNNGRLTVGKLDVDSPGREYRRSLTFSPLSASDMGSYSCSATVMPTVDNSGVTNGMRIGSDNLTVASKISNMGIFDLTNHFIFCIFQYLNWMSLLSVLVSLLESLISLPSMASPSPVWPHPELLGH